MPRGKIAKQPSKKTQAGRRGRPKRYNRHLELTASDVLRCVRLERSYGKSEGMIPDDAVIETKRVGQGFRYVVRWKGASTTAPSYQPPPEASVS